MKATIHFKKAEQNDKGFLLKLRKESMDEHLRKAGITMSDHQHFARIEEFFEDSYVIYQGENRIGLIKLSCIQNRYHIRQLQLIPSCQNQGIGSNLLTLLKSKASEKGLPITLNVLLNNPALNLYQRHGFVIESKTDVDFQMRWQAHQNKSIKNHL